MNGQHEDGAQAKRRAPRVDARGLDAALGQDVEPPASISIVNISTAGVAVLAGAPLGDVDEAFALRLGVPPRAATVQCRCTIRYVLGGNHLPGEAPQWLHGAEFLALEREASELLGDFVRDRLARGMRH